MASLFYSCFYTFAPFNRRFYISQPSEAGLLNITKEIYRLQSNRYQSTFKDARPFGSAFRMCNGVCYKFVMYVFVTDFSNPQADAYESLAGLSGGALLLLRKYTKKGKKNKR